MGQEAIGLITMTAECGSCEATGIYKGLAEREDTGVVCLRCKGTGAVEVSITPFAGRRVHQGIGRVYGANPGIIAGDGVAGGVSYAAWLADPRSALAPGAEMRDHVCPAWWYQTVDSAQKPEWDDEERRCITIGRFSQCEFNNRLAGCWEKWDRERQSGEVGIARG